MSWRVVGCGFCIFWKSVWVSKAEPNLQSLLCLFAFQAWVQDGYHAEIVETNWFIKQKVDYVNNNPVKDKVVNLPEDCYFSSTRNYAGLKNDLDVVVLELF